METPPSELPPLPPERIHHYQQQAQELLDRRGREFGRFVAGHKRLVQSGDELLRTRQTTGYNIALTHQDYPIDSDEPLIFYNNYIGRPRHFGLLLAAMEHEGVITPDQVRLGVKASKTIYGNWELAPDDEQLQSIQREGEQTPTRLSLTVETVAIFSPLDKGQALRIVQFLSEKAETGKPGAIEGSWETPDILATAVLKETLRESNLVEVTANILTEGQARLVAARQQTRFGGAWRNVPVEMNQELASYLASHGVQP